MKRILLSHQSFKLKIKRTIFISGDNNCSEILCDTEGFQIPHQAKLREVNRAYSLLNDAESEAKESALNTLTTSSINKDELLKNIAPLASKAVVDYLHNQGKSFEWQHFYELICIEIVAGCLGQEASKDFVVAASTLFGWIFNNEQIPFSQCPEHKKRLILLSLETLKESMSDSTLRLFIESHALLAIELQHLLWALTRHKKYMLKIYQVASIHNMAAMEHLIATMQEKRLLKTSDQLVRIVSKDTLINRSWFPNLAAKTGDRVILLAPLLAAKTAKQQELSTELQRSLVSSVLTELFYKHRIKTVNHNMLVLEELPKDPSAYHFSILGSSPPWAVAEEQTWLLDAHGIRNHLQHNVISIVEILRLVMLQKTRFYNANLFYVAYDKQHHILLGSPYSGGGLNTTLMGEQFKTFASHLPIKGPKNASDFSSLDYYDRCFEAYSTIRSNYYTWAYFSAFLDKGYFFVLRALLTFRKKPGFKPLTIVGNSLITLVVVLLAIALELPLIKTRIRNFFSAIVDENRVQMTRGIAVIDDILSDGRQFLFADEFTAADIHVCANLCNLIVPDEFRRGSILPPLENYPLSYRKGIETFRQTLTGRYVLRVYQAHRNSVLAHNSGTQTKDYRNVNQIA